MVDTQNTEQTDSSGITSLIFIREVPSSNVGRNAECPDFGFSGFSPDRFSYMKVNVGYASALAHPFRFVIY
jgi:hypothetical protein